MQPRLEEPDWIWCVNNRVYSAQLMLTSILHLSFTTLDSAAGHNEVYSGL